MSNWEQIAVVAGAVLPIFNIPLIIKLWKRKSAKDFSLVWVLGCWVCILLMAPAAITGEDMAFKVFEIMNLIFFSGVAFLVVKYHRS
ncbi:MAG: hypothetical protein HY586_00045 [Candidatus Omnitrophica bacterium]|nr:hypothetical protein [Candidatus Omnitrophota bacterium]